MRLVEVVMLMGAHCVSPVEHTPMMTDAAKVQCAVVIEKDTDKGTMTVTPPAAAADPQVMAAVERFRLAPTDPLATGGTKIVPAWAPAGSPTVEIKPPATPVAKAPAVPAPAPMTAGPPAPLAPSADLIGSTSTQPAVPAEAVADAPSPAAQTKAAPAPEQKVATLNAPPQKRPAAKAAARSSSKRADARKQPAAAKTAPKQASQCRGQAVAKWYKTADGGRKYRCVKPASDSAPDQLY